MNTSRGPRVNLLLVGAGLGNGLLAWHLRRTRPELKVVVLEAAPRLNTARTWSFHSSDVHGYDELKPLVSRAWTGYDVFFPRRQRRFTSHYLSMQPSRLEERLREALGADLRLGTAVRELSQEHAVLDDGTVLQADCVIDGRGQPPLAPAGYQKFVGLRLRLNAPHGLERPILMDARVPQREGFRFIYVLPWSDSELLIEDTRYSASPELDIPSYEEEIRAYARQRGWTTAAAADRETGSLPIPLFPPDAAGEKTGMPLRIGTAGGFFHPVTGYSLPDAVRVARRLGALSSITPAAVRAELNGYAGERAARVRFYCLLNRMMFLAATPAGRYRVFEHFYRLPENTIQRFYQGTTTMMDRLRILSGRPPVPVWSAVRSAFRNDEVFS